jgi:protein-disulfide isomerase
MPSLEKVWNTLLPLAALVMVGAVVHREMSSQAGGAPVPAAPPAYVKHWERNLLPAGITSGRNDAPVKLVEFTDFQCPFCKRYQAVLDGVAAKYGDQLSVTIIHYPLSSHPFAKSAAVAAECANSQKRFDAFAHLLYQKADSFGLKSWESYAQEAGVGDSALFTRCLADTALVPRVERGLNLARELDIPGTPTVVLNGWKYSRPPTDSLLRRAIDSILAHGTR